MRGNRVHRAAEIESVELLLHPPITSIHTEGDLRNARKGELAAAERLETEAVCRLRHLGQGVSLEGLAHETRASANIRTKPDEIGHSIGQGEKNRGCELHRHDAADTGLPVELIAGGIELKAK